MNLNHLFRLFVIYTIHFSYGQLCAQEVVKNTNDNPIKADKRIDNPLNFSEVFAWEPTTSYFLELLGKGFYSINVDFRKIQNRAISIGVQYTEDGDDDVFWPSLMYYHFSGERFRFETGGGLSAVFSQSDGLAGMGIHGVIGYRYQKKKGLFFRAGFTPLIGIPFTDSGRFVILPLIGLSLGYSF